MWQRMWGKELSARSGTQLEVNEGFLLTLLPSIYAVVVSLPTSTRLSAYILKLDRHIYIALLITFE